MGTKTSTEVVQSSESLLVRMARRVLSPRRAAGSWTWLLLLVVSLLVLFPIGALFFGSIREGTPGTPDAGFTLEYLSATFLGVVTGARVQTAAWNSLSVAFPATILATSIGVALAWLVARTDIPMRRTIEILAIAPMFYSALVGIIGWTILAGPRSGWLNIWYVTLTGSESGPFNIYTYWGIVFVMTLFYVPFAYMLNIGTLRSMDPAQEEAAAVAGASFWQRVWRIVLPSAFPSIAASTIFIFILALEQFSIPGYLGSDIRFRTLAYEVYLYTDKFPSNPSLAAAHGILLASVSLLFLIAYRRLTSRADKYVTVTSRGFKPSRMKLGALRTPALVVVLLFGFISMIVPLAAIVLRSLMQARTVGINFDNLTLGGYRDLFGAQYFSLGVKNSLMFSGVGATVVICLGLAIGWANVHRRSRRVALSDYLISIPIALPGTVFGIGVFWAYIGTPIYRTVTLMVLAFVIRYTVFGSRAATTGLMQLDKSLQEAARVSGASAVRSFLRVEVPLLRATLTAAWLLVFLSIMRELAASILIYGPRTRTLSILTWNYLEDGFFGIASAMAVMQVLIVGVIVLVFKIVFKDEVKLGGQVGQ